MTPKIKAKIKFCKFDGAIAIETLIYRREGFTYMDYQKIISELKDLRYMVKTPLPCIEEFNLHDTGDGSLLTKVYILSFSQGIRVYRLADNDMVDQAIKDGIEALESLYTPIIEEFPGGVVEVTV
tara:strand:- start:555 stop:929 length:375 start_codon:yes stop_codon:yes gene_type:complete